MSNFFYAKEWLHAREEWAKLIQYDETVQNGKPIENEKVAINLALEVYYRYRKIIHRLTACHDHIVQPQIREILGKMLDYSIVRMLEYRREIVALTLTECPWPIDTLIDLKLNPDDVDLRAPTYDAEARKTEFERDKKIAEDTIANDSIVTSSSLTEYTSLETFSTTTTMTSRRKRAMVEVEQKPQETPEERAAREAREAEMKRLTDAVLLIESFERARIGRREARKAARRQSLDRKVAAGTLVLKRISPAKQLKAAIIIQKTWRGFVARRQVKERLAELEKAIGMTIDSRKLRKRKMPQTIDDESLEESKMRSRVLKEFGDTFKRKKEKIWQRDGPRVIEDISEEVREWFLHWFDEVGYFDSIPAAEDGGTVAICTGEIRTPEEYAAELSSAKDKKGKGKDAKAADGDGSADKNEMELEVEGWQMPESKALSFLLETNQQFIEHWSLRTEQILHPDAPIVEDLVKEEIYYELQIEMRKIADQKLRAELDTLNDALKADLAAGGSSFSPPKAQVFPRADAKAKEKKDRERKDILGERTSEELLVELVRWKVIRECPQRNLDEWPAEVSLALRNSWEIRLGDVKQPLMDYCILPIASKAVNELAPFVRSVCLCGPPGSGQQFLAEAVCSELKATVFDLSPEKHIGRFIRRETQERLVQSVLKLARMYAPSVVLVEGCDKAWFRKVPPELRRVNPKRFAKVYSKIVKGIKPGDQVLFLTTSTEPYMAARSFVKIHDKFIIIPVADYGSLYRLYKKSLMSQPELDRHWEVSCMARLTAARTPLQVAEKALAVATGIDRRCDFHRHPLTQFELFDQLELLNPVPSTQIDQFHKFRLKLPLERKRRNLEIEEEQRQAALKKMKKK